MALLTVYINIVVDCSIPIVAARRQPNNLPLDNGPQTTDRRLVFQRLVIMRKEACARKMNIEI